MIEELWRSLFAFIFGAISSFIGSFVAFSRNKKKKTLAIENGMQALLRIEIIRAYEDSTARGYAPVYTKEAISRAYTAYHTLGGNDVATELYSKIIELPTDKKEVQ